MQEASEEVQVEPSVVAVPGVGPGEDAVRAVQVGLLEGRMFQAFRDGVRTTLIADELGAPGDQASGIRPTRPLMSSAVAKERSPFQMELSR